MIIISIQNVLINQSQGVRVKATFLTWGHQCHRRLRQLRYGKASSWPSHCVSLQGACRQNICSNETFSFRHDTFPPFYRSVVSSAWHTTHEQCSCENRRKVNVCAVHVALSDAKGPTGKHECDKSLVLEPEGVRNPFFQHALSLIWVILYDCYVSC